MVYGEELRWCTEPELVVTTCSRWREVDGAVEGTQASVDWPASAQGEAQVAQARRGHRR